MLKLVRIAACLLVGVRSLPAATPKASPNDNATAAAVISPTAKLASKAIQMPSGFSLATVASEPNLANPVAFCFDPAGRIFVAETYRVKKGVEDNRGHMDRLDDDLAARSVADRRAYLQRLMGERVKEYEVESELVRLLEDRDADGLYEHSTVFSDGYNNIEDGVAAGVLWSNDKLLFTCIPALWELRDADGDGQAEHKRALSTGYGVHFALYGHDLHGLCIGPDGKVYFSIGDRGLNVETPAGRLLNPDSGAVLRCNADGSELELFATGLRNPQELVFNEFGDLFTVDNNSDSGDQARLVHIVEGMEAGWRMSFQYLEDRGPFNREKIWHTKNAEQPASIVPPLAHITKGPSGLTYYPGTGWPAEYNGAFLVVDFLGGATSSGIRQFTLERDGATYSVKDYKPFITNVLATDCDFGPDGNFYVLDWVEGWDGPGVGRVHRFQASDADSIKQRAEFRGAMQSVAAASPPELLKLLGHPNMRVRSAAQQRMVALGVQSAAPLESLAGAKDAPLLGRIHAIWAMGQLATDNPQLYATIAERCGDEDTEIRAQAARALGWGAGAEEERRAAGGAALIKLLADPSPRVRSLAAIAVGKLRYEGALAALVQMAATDGDDPTLRHSAALGLAGSQTAERLVEAAKNATELQRLVLAVALGKQKSPRVATFLTDPNERVALDAARLIWDAPIPAANDDLAALITKTNSTSEPLVRRVLAANAACRSAEHVERVVGFTCRTDISPALRDLAWNLVRNWASPSPRDSVNGDWRPLEPATPGEVADVVRSYLPRLVKARDSNPIGLVVAAELGIQESLEPLLATIGQEDAGKDVRVRAIAAFSKADDGLTRRAIDQGVAAKDATVRSAARKLWSERFPDQVVDQLGETMLHGTMPERQAAMDTLASLSSPAAAKVIRHWVEHLEQGDCPPELQLEVLDAAGKSKDSELAARYRRFVENQRRQSPLAEYAACATGGDAERGKKLFQTNDTFACRRCHSVIPGVVLVGPCLASIGVERKPAEILESIVAPNAKIREGFETAVLELDSGKVVTGIVRHEDTSRIEIVDANAKTLVIDPATIENRVRGKSPMPEDLMQHMKPRELRDLVAYLCQLQAEDDPAKPKGAGHAESN